MKIYNYDANTGDFLGESDADYSPVNPAFPLIPAFATTIEPPTALEGKRAVFSDGAWALLDAAAAESPVPESPAETVEQTIARYEAALDAHLDAVARADRWNSRFTFALRASYPNAWRDKATAFGIWMDNCNAQAYALLKSVQEGSVEIPTLAEFIASLPAFEYN